jgi:hypothetical protein
MGRLMCPKCQRPRARGSLRCACGHVFEYIAAPRERTRESSTFGSSLMILALVAGGLGFLAVPPDPGHAGPGALCVVAGLFSIAGAIANWNWFVGSRRARMFVALLGRSGARAVYALLGGGLAGAGIALLLA